MDLTKKYFYRKIVNVDKLIKYGFNKSRECFYLSQNILDDEFSIQITVKSNVVDVLVFDNNFEDLYMNVFNEKINGEFVNKIRSIMDELLIDISNKCFDKVLFPSAQANRLAKYIESTYDIKPDFPWELKEDETYAVYRNKDNNLWFGLVMDVKDNKLAPNEKGKVVINIKPHPSLFIDLLKVKGIYPGWHMNKKSWLSISLDDTFPDEYIESLVDSSFNETIGKPLKKYFPKKKCP